MGRGKHPRNQDSASRRAAAEAGLRARREANRERTTDHVGSVLERPRQIIAEAVLRGTGDRDAVENARNQVNAIRLAVEGDPDLYPSVTQERLDEMGKLIDQANEILDRSSERGQATEGGNVVNSRVSEKKKSRKERPAEAKKKSVQKTKEPAPAPEATDVPKQSVEVAPAISVGAPKSTEKFRLELVEDELDDVSDRLQTMNALMRPHEESPGEVAARVVAEPQAVEVLKAVDSERVYSQKEVKQLLREMNKKIGNSFRARDAQRKMQKDTLVAELDVDGGLVSTTGERGLLGKRHGKEDKNKNEDNTFVREIRREQGREDKADPAAENREKLRAFTRAIVDFKNAIEELRQRVLNFDVDPDEDGLQSAYDLLRETEARAAAAFENIPAGSPGYDINQELAASAIRDQERVLVLLTSLREKQGVAAAEKTRERASSAEREAQDRALLESALDGLSAAQDSCGKEMARIQRLVVAGKQWNAENLNFAIQDVKDMKRNLGMTLKLVGDARIDDLMKRAEELEVTYRQLRERREELLRFIEEKEREAADATRQADEENTVELPVDEVAQDLTQAAIIPDAEKTQPVEKVSWLRRYAPNMRRFFSYLTSGWQEAKNLAQDSVELAGAQMTGALTSSERGEIELGNLSEGARLASSLLGNVVLTGTGTKFLVDLPRYVSQKHFAAGERERLTEELSEIVTKDKLDERERYQYARSEELARSIRNSRYLTKQQREEMLARLYAVDEAYRGERKEEDEEAKKAIAKIIEKAIKTRISGTRVVKEALNTALIMTGPAAFLLRPGAYGVVSLVERYQNVSEAEPDKAMADKMKQAFADGFGEWWQKIKGEVGDTRTKQELNRLAAIGTLARAFGVVGGALAETAMITSLLTAAGAPLLLGEGEGIVPEPIIKLTEKEPVLNDARIFVPEDAPSVGMGLEEDPDAFLAAVTGETPETPETFETYTGGVPVGSEVKKFDGIVGALMRVIKANPEAYGFDGDTDIGQELFAKKLAMQMASKEGIVNNDWLSDKSIGNLYVIPERDGDSWKLTFVDKDMHKLSFDDVREQGYVVKANNARMV